MCDENHKAIYDNRKKAIRYRKDKENNLKNFLWMTY
jgi:hypothetical protein